MIHFHLNKPIYIARRDFLAEKEGHLFNIPYTFLSLLPLDLTWQSLPRGNLRRRFVRSDFVIFVERRSLRHRWISALKRVLQMTPLDFRVFLAPAASTNIAGHVCGVCVYVLFNVEQMYRDVAGLRCFTTSEMMHHSRPAGWDRPQTRAAMSFRWCRRKNRVTLRGEFEKSSRSMRAEMRSAWRGEGDVPGRFRRGRSNGGSWCRRANDRKC